MTGIVRKSIFYIFVLRVSGKGDTKGSMNQLEVLKEHRHRPGVSWLLENFDADLMRASSARGRRLRAEWERAYGLEVLSRRGRSDFLGVTIVIEGTRFILYASTAAQMDESTGNAFTRHLIRFIKEPAFTGHADPEFTRRRDDGHITGDHPSLCIAFDVTRFVRSMEFASQLWEAARFGRAAFDVKDIRVDPEGGEGQQMMWNFLAYGSQMEAEVGKIRRFVGHLNTARAGYFPRAEPALPLGFALGTRKPRPLLVKPQHVEMVAALCRLGLTSMAYPELATILGRDHGVQSTDGKTAGTPLHELLHPEDAVKRLYQTRKLRAYREGAFEMVFTGVLPNRLRPGSGHVLTRRWPGIDEHGRHDEYGQISYTIPAPKPTVTDDRGHERPGWLAGVSAEQEHDMWTRLIDMRGRSEQSTNSGVPTQLHATSIARSGARHEQTMPLTRLCLFRDIDAGPKGPRSKLFSRAASEPEGGRYELRRELCASAREGIKYQETALVASWPDAELHGYVATLLRQGVSRLLAEGHHLGALEVTLPPAVVQDLAKDNADQAQDLRAKAAAARARAKSAEEAEVEERTSPEPDPERIQSFKQQSRAHLAEARQMDREADQLTAVRTVPSVDFGMVRDVIAAVEGPFARGLAPRGLNEALHALLPEGIRFTPGHDSVTLTMTARVSLPLEAGGSLTARLAADVPFAARSRAGENGQDRIADLTARYMRDGHSIDHVAEIGRLQPAHLLALMKEHLKAVARGAEQRSAETEDLATTCIDTKRLPRLIGIPIPEIRALTWQRVVGERHAIPGVSQAYARLIERTYVLPARINQPEGGAGQAENPDGGSSASRTWAWDADVDHRREMQTILLSLPGPRKAMTAEHLADALGSGGVVTSPLRHVHTSSTATKRRAGTYPATLTRYLRGRAGTWAGQESLGIPADNKMVELVRCPHNDCPEKYATAIVLADEVLCFGTGNLCRRCKRPAVDTPEARDTVFPDSVIAWSDNQPTRTGSWRTCAASGCTVDAGAGRGQTWKWDDQLGAVWHNEHCRTGSLPPSTYRPCQYVDCIIDEGEGPGSLDIGGQRSSRRWHTRACEHAEDRRQRRASRAAHSAPCGWVGCTTDNGAGTGVIAAAHHAQKVHANDACRAGWRRGERRT